MFKIALLGRDIGYTRSPQVHAAIGEYFNLTIDCAVYDVPFDKLEETVKHLLNSTHGFFVTKPYKTEVAKMLGCDADSVNVVRRSDNNAISTDARGFLSALGRNFPDWESKVNGVLVLGAGGAASAIVGSLVAVGKKVYVLNRTAMKAAKLCSAYGAELYVNQPCEMVVNCTSVGTHGEDVFKSLCVLPTFDYAFDLIYCHERTPFLRRAEGAGAKVANGTDMLIYQAIEGIKYLLLSDADTEKIYDSVQKILQEGNI